MEKDQSGCPIKNRLWGQGRKLGGPGQAIAVAGGQRKDDLDQSVEGRVGGECGK